MTNVVDLAARLALHESVRPFLTLLEASPKIGEVLEAVLPQVTKEQQRVLLAVVIWRLMGAQLPASIELLKRLPVLHGLHPESIQAALVQLHDADILAVQQHGEESAFVWPALETVVFIALQETHAPKSSLVGLDGEKLR